MNILYIARMILIIWIAPALLSIAALFVFRTDGIIPFICGMVGGIAIGLFVGSRLESEGGKSIES
jgi:hypothetical protein